MPRCTKKDEGRGDKRVGCVKEAGHSRRHKVREAPEECYQTGTTPLPPGAPDAETPAGLDGVMARVEREIVGLARDCREIVDMLQAEAERVRKRNVALLKFIQAKRRKMAELRDRLRAAKADAKAARLEAEEEDPEDDDEDEGA